ncbi:MAG: hypothetical protein JWM98_912 [Thermoleophilia bacterium]|nr:hypothetical protein [Thermoleophilia bacterium]
MLQFLLLGAVLVAVWTVLALLADRFMTPHAAAASTEAP